MTKQYLVDIDIGIGQDVIEIKQIPSFSALVKSAEFRAKQFFQMVGSHLAIPMEPLIFNRKWFLNQSKHIEMFTTVDFDFQANLNDWRDFRINSEEKRIAVASLFDDFAWHEGEHFSKSLQDRLDGTWMDLDQINVFTEARLWMEKQLVQGGAASERQLGCKKLVAVNGYQTTTDDQVLLGLLIGWPWCVLMPIVNVLCVNHISSISGITFTWICHLEF